MPALWPFRPDGSVLEAYSWLTGVLPGATLIEQRRERRSLPRQSWEIAYVLSQAAQRTAENILQGNLDGTLYLPVWMDAQPLGYLAETGDGALEVANEFRDYSAGRLVALINPDEPLANELALVDDVPDTSTLTLDGTLAADWPAGTLVAPVREVYIGARQDLNRFTGGDVYFSARFNAVDYREHAAASETSYRDYPVLTRRPNWVDDPEASVEIEERRIDSGVGVRYRRNAAIYPVRPQRHLWTLAGRADIDAYLGWLYARAGRLTAFWSPSWAQDLAVAANIGSGDTTIDVELCGYTAHVAQAPGRRDIRLETRAGVAYHRRITASEVVSATTERLTIDSALGAAVTAANVALVSFMDLSRLENDTVQLDWWNWETVDSRVTSRGIRNAA